MVNAGIEIDDSVVAVYDDLRLKHKYHYVVYKIENKKKIVVDTSLAAEEKFDYAAFHKAITSSAEPRYIILDYHYFPEPDRPASKIVFITWVPDNGGVGAKMLYASAKEDFKKKLQGIGKAHQANDVASLEESQLLATVKA